MRRLAGAVVVAGLVAGTAEAGPWAQGKGRVYAKLGYGHLTSDTLYAPDGTSFDIPTFRRDEVNGYVSVGLTDRLNASANVPVWLSSDLQDFGRESGFGDVKAGLQLQLAKRGPWVFAVRGGVQAPTGDETRADGLLPTGTGVWEGELIGGVGRSLHRGQGWTFVEVGHGVRGGQLRDTFLYAGQLGWHVASRLSLSANVRGVEPWDSSFREVALGSPTGLSDRVRYTTYGASAFFKLTGPWTLQLDVEDTFRARNLARGVMLRTGIAYSR